MSRARKFQTGFCTSCFLNRFRLSYVRLTKVKTSKTGFTSYMYRYIHEKEVSNLFSKTGCRFHVLSIACMNTNCMWVSAFETVSVKIIVTAAEEENSFVHLVKPVEKRKSINWRCGERAKKGSNSIRISTFECKRWPFLIEEEKCRWRHAVCKYTYQMGKIRVQWSPLIMDTA